MFLVLLLPLILINFVLALKGVPSTYNDHSSSQAYQQAFKDVLFNKSALACLLAYVLKNMGANTVVATFSISFYRQTFLVDTAFISLAFMVFSLISIVGSLIGGRLITRFGRKPLTVWSVLLISVLTISFMNITHLWASLMLWFVDSLFVAIAVTAYYSLALEQAPDNRATMMSLNEVSMFGGTAIGNAVGGVLLVAFNYQILGLMGIFIFIGSIILHIFTTDPTKGE
jgi:predicted MFS family arabinose efflux permease